MSKKENVVQEDFNSFKNKKLISKALNNELNFFEKIKLKKILKVNKWSEYYNKVKEMENRVDKLLFISNEKINYQVLSKLNLPNKYQKLIEQEYSNDSREITPGFIDLLLSRPFIIGFCTLLLAFSGYVYVESMQWSREFVIASISSVAILATYTITSQS